jgi:hypothetical protein
MNLSPSSVPTSSAASHYARTVRGSARAGWRDTR